MIVDLTGEYAAAIASMTEADRAQLTAVGVPPRLLDMVGTTRIDLDAQGRTYQPLEIGDKAFILPVRVGDAWTPEHQRPAAIAYCGALVDLIAWHPDTPDHWALRIESATWLGGIPPQLMNPDPVSVRRSPLSWLRAGGAGFCILTRDGGEIQQLLLRCRGGIEAEDNAHAAELRELLERPLPMPPITVVGKTAEVRAA